MGHSDAAFEQEFFHVAVAQGEARGEPDPVTDDCTGKTVIPVAPRVGQRGHVWLSILVCKGLKPPLADASLDRRFQNEYKIPVEARRCAPVALRTRQGLACLGDVRAYAEHHAVPGELVD